jgi:hypothetical protein
MALRIMRAHVLTCRNGPYATGRFAMTVFQSLKPSHSGFSIALAPKINNIPDLLHPPTRMLKSRLSELIHVIQNVTKRKKDDVNATRELCCG